MHPLTVLMSEQKWNNIPITVKEVFDMVCHAMIGQDIHTWERKNIANDRFIRLEKLVHKLADRQDTMKSSIMTKFAKEEN